MNVKKLSALLTVLCDGETQVSLAKKVGVPAPTLGAYLRCNVKEPSTEFLLAIADYMDITLDDLVNRISDNPKRNKRVKESCSPYQLKIASFEELAPFIDNLPDSEKKRVAIYATQAITV